jgi:hypothetical protein
MLAAVFAVTTFAASGASANLLINGSFESPTISFPFYENYGPTNLGNYGGTSFSGWTITVNNVDIVSQVGGWLLSAMAAPVESLNPSQLPLVRPIV